MAKLKSVFPFLGRLGNVTAYKVKGSDEIILRTHGGPKKENIKKDPKHANQRRSYSEFGARGTAAKYLRKAIFPIYQLADYNFTCHFNPFMRQLQVLDSVNEVGKRGISFSKNPRLLEGFNFNKKNTFDSYIKNPLSVELDKGQLSARIDFPEMIPGITFLDSFTSYPLYCFVTVLGFVPDIIHTKNGYQPFDKARSVIAMSDWYPVKKGSPIVSLASNLLSNPPTVPGFTVVLSAGIRFGTIGTSEQLNHVKCPGAAKIVAME